MSIVMAYMIVVTDFYFYNIDVKLLADLQVLHDLNFIMQLDVFAFHVGSPHQNLLIKADNQDKYRQVLVANLAMMKDYISKDTNLLYEGKDFQKMKDTLYFRNVCDLIKSVAVFY
jgi:hypothetical protein